MTDIVRINGDGTIDFAADVIAYCDMDAKTGILGFHEQPGCLIWQRGQGFISWRTPEGLDGGGCLGDIISDAVLDGRLTRKPYNNYPWNTWRNNRVRLGDWTSTQGRTL